MNRSLVVLKLPRAIAALILFLRHVVLRMMSSPWFPKPTPALDRLKEHVDALDASHVQALKRTPGAAAVRDVNLQKVREDADQVKALIQSVIDENPDDALVIAESAALSLKQHTPRQMPELSAQMSKAPGVVILRAKAHPKRGVAYEWQYSTDRGTTWVTIAHTTVATCDLSGVTTGTAYLFRFRTTVKKTTGAWSQVIALMTH